jgi:hypothetical protein
MPSKPDDVDGLMRVLGVDFRFVGAPYNGPRLPADIRNTLEIMMPGGGYCFAPTHALQDNSPTENVVAMYKTAIAEALACLARFGIALPAFAFWTPAEWERQGPDAAEIRDCMLGWDVTDFGSGRFAQIGRTLFTLRNGTTRKPGYAKTCAQKYLFDPES